MIHRRIAPIFVLLCLLSLASVCFGQQAAPAAGKLVEVKVPAPSLKGNLLSDPLEQNAVIYLPPSYNTSATKRYPVVYLLHGFLGDLKAWTDGGYQGLRLNAVMDDLISSGKSKEMIVVAPTAKNAYLGSFYANSVVTGNWADYILRDLVSYVDANYRTLAQPESRGVAGHSMGGYGALVLGMRHPDVFSSIYAMSPCCTGMEGDFGPDNPAWSKTLHLTSRDQLKSPPRSFDEFYQVVFVALSAALSPNPAHPPFFVDFPYQERDGRIEKNDVAYAKWKANLPLYMVSENKDNLLKLHGIAIDIGQKEEFASIRVGGRMLSAALAEQGIPHTFEIYEAGTHGSLIRQRVETRVFAFFSEKLSFGADK
ncbi:MAG TPA: alpha/beta fold hydrolase [Pyrinomonadaceae bacterium]|nr:alpha/beta fold hydrolase [Pyrinomonadaceae bacterium]